MTTSNVTTYNESAAQIITDALILIEATGAEDAVNASDYAFGARMLNKLIKMYEAKKVGIWAKEEGVLFLVPGQSRYDLGTGAVTQFAGVAGTLPVRTTLSAAGASSATTLTLTTVTNMSVSDNIGIVLDTGLIQWTTITAINTSTLVVTLNAALTSAAASGNIVYTYTTGITRPYDITQCRRQDSSNFEVPMTKELREVYMNYPNKTIQSKSTFWYLDVQRDYSSIYVWPAPDSANDTINFTFSRVIQDVTLPTQTMDFPQEWLMALTYELAVALAPAYGKLQLLGAIGAGGLKDSAKYYYDIAAGFAVDDGYIQYGMLTEDPQ